MQTLDIISINIWQMLISLINLTLLFLIVKKFLYKPAKKMLQKRQEAIEQDYEQATQAKEQAYSDKIKYEEKLQSAKAEADSVIQSAVNVANQREKEILLHAKEKAEGIIRQAENEAVLERKKAEDGIKKEIVEVSSLLTQKVIEREVSAQDHQHFIDSFIESIGDENESE